MHYYETDTYIDTVADIDEDVTLTNYDKLIGAFDLNSIQFSANQNYRYTTMKACMAGKDVPTDKTFQLYFYELDCVEEAYIYYDAEYNVNLYLDDPKDASDPNFSVSLSDGLGFLTSNSGSCTITLTMSSTKTYSDTHISCDIDSDDILTCEILDDFAFGTDTDGVTPLTDETFTLDVIATMSPNSVNTHLSALTETRSININVLTCNKNLCEYCDENKI